MTPPKGAPTFLGVPVPPPVGLIRVEPGTIRAVLTPTREGAFTFELSFAMELPAPAEWVLFYAFKFIIRRIFGIIFAVIKRWKAEGRYAKMDEDPEQRAVFSQIDALLKQSLEKFGGRQNTGTCVV